MRTARSSLVSNVLRGPSRVRTLRGAVVARSCAACGCTSLTNILRIAFHSSRKFWIACVSGGQSANGLVQAARMTYHR